MTVRSWMLRLGGLIGCAAVCLWIQGCDEGGEMQILDVDPKAGHTKGDQYVTILGDNLRQDIGYTVYFGTQKAKQVTILDPETLLVSTPTGNEVGSVDIMIRADNGDAWRIREGFKFEDMGGSVVEGLGNQPAEESKGNLAY